MERTKESAAPDFMRTISKSWTYCRLTEEEKDRLDDAIDFATLAAVKGSFNRRWDVLQAVYHAFLNGVGYNGPTWREPNPNEVPAF